jgi:hypothetical protein
MPHTQLSPLQRQLGRVGRRLFWQKLVTTLLWSWAAALAATALWFVAQPHLIQDSSGWLRLGVAGGALAAASFLALGWALFRAPPRLAAALMLDEKFGLKERVTTSLTLAPDQEATPAGQALLADVNERLERLNVSTRFPLHVSWLTTVAPACAAIIALAAFFYQPAPTQAIAPKDKETQAPANAAEIEQKMKELKKRVGERRPHNKLLDEKLKEFEGELDQIANRPRDSQSQRLERVKEMTKLEEKMKNQEKELADKSRSLQKQLAQLDQTARQSGNQDGPGKDLEKALAKADLKQAREEMDKLVKKLKENQLTQKEKSDLSKQLDDLQKKLERLSDQQDKKDELKKLNQEGKLDADALKRELKALEEQSQKLQDMKKLAKQLAQCQQALQNGNSQQAAQGLEDAAEQLKEMDLQDQDLQDLREQLQRLADAKDSC